MFGLRTKSSRRPGRRAANTIHAACHRALVQFERLEDRTLLSIVPAATTTTIDHSSGFAGLLGASPDMTVNGIAKVTMSTDMPPNALQLVNGGTGEAGGAFSNDPLGVDTFDTTFDFSFGPNAGTTTPPGADGFTFTLQNDPRGSSALGASGGVLAYAGIKPSVMVQFNLYNNVSQTGVFAGGVTPPKASNQGLSTTPLAAGVVIDLTKNPDGSASPINFHTNATDQYRVHLVYDGTTLTETVTDVTMSASVSQKYTVDVAQQVGGHMALAGFTGATGGVTSEQDVLDWKYSGVQNSSTVTLPTPVISGVPCQPGEIMLSWSNVTGSETGFDLERSSDNGKTFASIGTPAMGQTTFTDTGLDANTSYEYEVKALGNGTTILDSAFSTPTPPITGGGLTNPVAIAHSSGFAGASDTGTPAGDIHLLGNAKITGATDTPPDALRLITGSSSGSEDGQAWDANYQLIDKFNTTFDFTFGSQVPPDADGFTFTIQNDSRGLFATGQNGGNLGYGGIGNSVAIKFDLYDGAAPAGMNNTYNATGVYSAGNTPMDDPRQGVDPTTPAMSGTSIDLKTNAQGQATGIDFHANPTDDYKVNLVYDGTTLTETVTDVTRNVSVKQAYTIDIPGSVGATCAYVGFTASDGGLFSQPNVLDWTFSHGPPQQQGPKLVSTSFGDSITGATLNNTTQRSEVRDVQLKFDHPVTLASGAVTLAAYSGNTNSGTTTDASTALGAPTTSDNGLTWTVPVLPNTAFSDSTGSLKDGVYKLTIVASKVTDSSNNTLSGGDQSTNFFRLFGDFNGDGKVNNADYFQFNKSFGKSSGQTGYNGIFDFNGDNKINNSDYFQFNKNFGKNFQLI